MSASVPTLEYDHLALPVTKVSPNLSLADLDDDDDSVDAQSQASEGEWFERACSPCLFSRRSADRRCLTGISLASTDISASDLCGRTLSGNAGSDTEYDASAAAASTRTPAQFFPAAEDSEDTPWPTRAAVELAKPRPIRSDFGDAQLHQAPSGCTSGGGDSQVDDAARAGCRCATAWSTAAAPAQAAAQASGTCVHPAAAHAQADVHTQVVGGCVQPAVAQAAGVCVHPTVVHAVGGCVPQVVGCAPGVVGLPGGVVQLVVNTPTMMPAPSMAVSQPCVFTICQMPALQVAPFPQPQVQQQVYAATLFPHGVGVSSASAFGSPAETSGPTGSAAEQWPCQGVAAVAPANRAANPQAGKAKAKPYGKRATGDSLVNVGDLMASSEDPLPEIAQERRDGRTTATWRVSSARLTTLAEKLVSPDFTLEVPGFPLQRFKAVLVARESGRGGRHASSFRRCKGKVDIFVKCQGELAPGFPKIAFRIGVSEAVAEARVQWRPSLRRPAVAHDFANTCCAGLTEHEEWSLREIVGKAAHSCLIKVQLEVAAQ